MTRLPPRIVPLPARKRIALVAHDSRKPDMVAWVGRHRALLEPHALCATGTTGRVLQDELGLHVERLLSGPLGGDQQMGARIAEGQVDLLVFLWDPLEAQPHDPDVKALLRIAAVWNGPVATNLASADFIVSSPFLEDEYPRMLPDHAGHRRFPDLREGS